MLNANLTEYGSLTCRVIDALPAGVAPQKLVVLCHGFGAPGDDLVTFGPHLISESSQIAETCRFVFPEAPIDLGPMGLPGGRAWWPINMAQLAAINETQDFEQLCAVTPDGMRDASRQLHAAIEQALADCPNAPSLVVGGFSQGAMVTTDVVLHHGLAPAQMILFSGTLLCREDWAAKAAAHPGCPVFQSHGRQDAILPFEPATWLRDLLLEQGFDVEFQEFSGEHAIPMPVLQRCMQILS